MPHCSVHVGVDDHPMTAPAAPCVDLEPPVVLFKHRDDVAVFARPHTAISGDRKRAGARSRQRQITHAVVRENRGVSGEEFAFHRLAFEVCMELEVVRFGGDENLVNVALLNRERNLRINRFFEFA